MRKFSKELYSKEVLMKAAFSFTDIMYIHLDTNEQEYLVTLIAKDNVSGDDIYLKFENELIAQQTRLIVAEKTKNIREMIVARSLSSTIINISPIDDEETDDFKADDILIDWFEKNE